jgi:hypothetical protein
MAAAANGGVRRPQAEIRVTGPSNPENGVMPVTRVHPKVATSSALSDMRAQIFRAAGPAATQKLMRSLSRTCGLRATRVWIAPMYSPMIPMKKSCTDAKKKRPMTTGATPSANLSQ